MTRIVLAVILFVLSLPAMAQDTAEEERSFFVRFVEEQLSTPNRRIGISGIQGVLSSDATIGQITIADRDGDLAAYHQCPHRMDTLGVAAWAPGHGYPGRGHNRNSEETFAGGRFAAA